MPRFEMWTSTIPSSEIETGTGAGMIVALDGSAKLPAVDGSQLTNIVAAGRLIKVTVFTSSDTFTKQAATNAVLVECVGGGGEGYAGGNGGAGGTSSFGAFCSATGGGGGLVATAGAGGAGSGGNINLTGETPPLNVTRGGNAAMSFGWGSLTSATAGGAYGGGSAGQAVGQGGGGGGGYTREFITSYTNATETVTVGAGGSGNTAADGGAGVVVVYEYT